MESESTSVSQETVTEFSWMPSWIPTSVMVGAGVPGSHSAPLGFVPVCPVYRTSRGRRSGPPERRLNPKSMANRPAPFESHRKAAWPLARVSFRAWRSPHRNVNAYRW
jgi:hypothetical protein